MVSLNLSNVYMYYVIIYPSSLPPGQFFSSLPPSLAHRISHQLFLYEALGLCREGEGGRLIDSGRWVPNSHGMLQYSVVTWGGGGGGGGRGAWYTLCTHVCNKGTVGAYTQNVINRWSYLLLPRTSRNVWEINAQVETSVYQVFPSPPEAWE